PGASLCLLVLDAEARVGKRLDAGLLDGLPASLAEAERSLVDARERLLDLLEQVAHVVLQGQVLLPFEGGRAGVRVFLVEGGLARQVRLGLGERGGLELGKLRAQLLSLLEETLPQIIDLPGGESFALRQG